MKDKLVKILNLKIDDVNKNINNLNFLNEELEKSNKDIEYVNSILSEFKDGEDYNILNFGKLEKNDFDKVISMIDQNVYMHFENKGCNYDGIMYIIQGINQGISLVLTVDQTTAINEMIKAIEEKEKEIALQIANLNTSKSKLNETNLDILKGLLIKYRTIVSKLEADSYVIEIEEVINALDFTSASVEERIEIFSYLLKYNADIYEEDKPIISEVNEDNSKLNEVQFAPFVYSSSEEDVEESSDEEDDNNESIKEVSESYQTEFGDDASNYDIPFDFSKIIHTGITENNIEEPINLSTDAFKVDDVVDLTNTLPKEETVDFDFNSQEEPINSSIHEEEYSIPDTFEETTFNIPEEKEEVVPSIFEETPFNIPEEKVEVVPSIFEETPFNAPEEEKVEVVPSIFEETAFNIPEEKEEVEVSVNNINYDEIEDHIARYNLHHEEIIKNIKASHNDITLVFVDAILSKLKELTILDIIKDNDVLISRIITESENDKIDNICNIVKNNFVSKEHDFNAIINIIAMSMPSILIGNREYINFIQNVELFKGYGINLINLFDNYRELLIVDTNLLKENYNKVGKYNLKINNENVKYLLYIKEIAENIDYYLEINIGEKGLFNKKAFDGYDYIIKNPYKLNNINREIVIRLNYANENNHKIYGNKPGILAGEITNLKVNLLNITDEYRNQYFNNEYGFVEKEELDKLVEMINGINDYDLEIDDVISSLDKKYKISDLRYEINGLYISRIKTIRIYNYLKDSIYAKDNSLLIALTYNSVIKKDNFTKIEEIVNKIIKGDE